MNKSKQRTVYIFIYIAFTIYLLYVVNDAYSKHFGFPIIVRLSYLPYALGLIVIAALISFRSRGFVFTKEYIPWFFLFVFGIMLMLVVGYIRKNPMNLIYPDLEGMIMLASAMVIGAKKENLPSIIKVFFTILSIGIIINFLSIFTLNGLARYITEHSLVNKTQGLLFPVYFLFLLYPVVDKKKKLLVIVAIVLLFILSIFFQKRLTFLHVLTTIFLFVNIYSISQKNVNSRFLKNSSIVLLIVLLFFLGSQILAFAGYDITYSLEAFYQRAIGNVGFINKVETDGRYQIAGEVITTIFSSGNGILGYGLGGFISSKNMWYSIYAGNELMLHTTSSIEVGQTWPLWKGGVIFTLIYQILTLKLIFSYRKFKKNYFLIANWAFVLVSYLFFYGEHFWSGPENMFFLFLMGTSYGVLMSYKKYI